MERTRRPHIPSFGDWNYSNEVPITFPVKPIHRKSQPMERRSGVVKQRNHYKAPMKPVDEDLYKIPPELVKKPRRRLLRSFFTGCLGFDCIV